MKNKEIENDFERLKLIISNLIENSIKYTNKGSITILITKINSDLIEIKVIDTGIGITPNIIPYLFTMHGIKKTLSDKE